MPNITKSIFVSFLFIPLLVFILSPAEGFAQNQAVLPNAGLTPESPFYFLDKFGEALREFFTFNPEGKARLQITFAAERIAEIKVVLETKGVDAKGLEVAESRLLANLARVNVILAGEKQAGKDVSALAKELDDDFDGPKSALKEAFKAEERAFEIKEEELKAKIREARRAGDTARVEALVKELGEVKAQKELLELKEDEQEEALEQEEEKLEREIEDKAEAEKAIREAEKEKREVLDEAAEEGITVPAEAFEKFNRLLAQAKELFDRGNYQGAKQLAGQAEKSLDKVEEAIEELSEAKKEAEDLEEKLKDKEREAKEEPDGRAKKEVEREAERLEREQKKAEAGAERAEKQLRDIDDED